MNHGNRFEDVGIGKLLKFWPQLIALFMAGALYQSVRANAILTDKHENAIQSLDRRTTQVEDAVIYLKEIVKQGQQGK